MVNQVEFFYHLCFCASSFLLVSHLASRLRWITGPIPRTLDYRHSLRIVDGLVMIYRFDWVLATSELLTAASTRCTCRHRCFADCTPSDRNFSHWIDCLTHRRFVLQVELISVSMQISITIPGALHLGWGSNAELGLMLGCGSCWRNNILDWTSLLCFYVTFHEGLLHHHFLVYCVYFEN
jgi:hypothetical protein